MSRITHPLEIVLDEAFWSLVEKRDDGCWVWLGHCVSGGHGEIRFNGRRERVHRVVYERLVEEIPAGHHVHHECRNRPCVNPAHLRALPGSEHMRLKRPSQQRKTHCPKGHEYTPENTYVARNGAWHCRTCARVKTKEWRSQNPEKVRGYRRQWREKNVERAREHARAWRARQKGRAEDLPELKEARGLSG